MAQHFWYNDSGIKVQYGYGIKQSGFITMEIMKTDSPIHYRAVLKKDEEIIYDREISIVDIDTFNYIGVPKVTDDLLCAGYIASLWNHRMLYLMYGDEDSTLYQAAVAICNLMAVVCYDYDRLGFITVQSN